MSERVDERERARARVKRIRALLRFLEISPLIASARLGVRWRLIQFMRLVFAFAAVRYCVIKIIAQFARCKWYRFEFYSKLILCAVIRWITYLPLSLFLSLFRLRWMSLRCEKLSCQLEIVEFAFAQRVDRKSVFVWIQYLARLPQLL